MAYLPRVVDTWLDELFPHLAAVALEGAKGVGKTATGTQRARTVVDLANPAQRSIAAADYDYIARSRPPVLIDEWQLLPAVWDRVKAAVDQDRTGGRFLLAGSAGVKSGVRIHSGAGRIVAVPMRPLSIAERRISSPTVSLAAMLRGEANVGGETDLSLPNYVEEILASGFPEIRLAPPRVRRIHLESYLSRIVEHELPENGAIVRRPDALRHWLAAYAAATATDASYTKILDAATPGETDKPTRATVATYREHLLRVFLLDPVAPWSPLFTPLKRLTATPKHHLVDPALAAVLVGVGADGLLRGEGLRVATNAGTWLGALFESLVAQSLRVYAHAADARVFHLRTKDSAREIDFIIEADDRRVLGVEAKLAATTTDRDVRHLNWLQSQLGDQVIDRVVINTGPAAYRRRDGVAVVPLALLGP